MWTGGTCLGDHLADGAETIQRLADDGTHLLRQLAVLFFLLLLLQFLWGWTGHFGLRLRLRLRLGDVLDQSTFAQPVVIVVHDVAIVVDFFSDECGQVTGGQLADEVSVDIAHFSLAGDLATSHGIDVALLLLGLPTLRMANCVTVLVEDVAIFVDLATKQVQGIAFDGTADDAARGIGHHAVLANDDSLKAIEGTLRLLLLSVGDQLHLADDLAFVAPDLALTVDLATSQSAIAGDNAPKEVALGVDDIADLVDRLAVQDGEIGLNLLLLRRLVRLGVTLDAAELIDDVAFFIGPVCLRLSLGLGLGSAVLRHGGG